METLRRSTRATTSKVSYTDEFSPSYPDKEPVNDFERRVASLNQQSFPWKELSVVDDILVYSLFSSKRRTKGSVAIKTERVFGEEETPVTAKDGIIIRKIVENYLPEKRDKKEEDFGIAAQELVKALPAVFLQEQMAIIEQ
jgi:hypothetical protein